MIRDIETTLFNMLTPEQIDKALEESIRFAKQRHANVVAFYESYADIDPQFAENYEDMIVSSKWESFLPKEYYTLKSLRDEQEKRKAC